MEVITSDEDTSHREEAERIIASIKHCVDRGVDPQSGKRGKCHVFLDHSDICQCEDVDLTKERMKVKAT